MQRVMSPERGQRTKAIVFTQFWQHLNLIERQLTDHGVGLAVLKGSMKSDEKARSLDQFKVANPSVCVSPSVPCVAKNEEPCCMRKERFLPDDSSIA